LKSSTGAALAGACAIAGSTDNTGRRTRLRIAFLIGFSPENENGKAA
jgi:hypothetical protein